MFSRTDRESRATDGAGWLQLDSTSAPVRLVAGGRWDIRSARRLDRHLSGLKIPAGAHGVDLDLKGLEGLDTVGAWLLRRTELTLKERGLVVRRFGVAGDFAGLIDQMDRIDHGTAITPERPSKIIEVADRLGRAAAEFLDEGIGLMNFTGVLAIRFAGALIRPRRISATAIFYHMEAVGLNALPIVGLLSFLIGIVLAYQGALQLQRFGAEILVVNLLGISVLRVLGVFLTAIIIAGRSGSAFTAQIGTMKVREEVDALRTIGLDPIDVLVLPRVIALAITLPLLAFYASVVAIAGGAVMSRILLDIPFATFMQQFKASIPVVHLWVGLVQAPVFAAVIAMVGCYQGMRVTGSAQSVGQLTTKSVVMSIFLVIVLTAVFSIAFANWGV